MATNKKKLSRTAKALFIVIGLLAIAFGSLYIFQRNLFYVSYYYITADHFNTGDKIYLDADIVNNHPAVGVSLCRLIRPVTAADTLNIEVDTGKMVVKTSFSNSLLKTYAIPCNTFIDRDSLRKYNTAAFGQYTGHYIYNTKATDNSFVLVNFFSVAIDKRICRDSHRRFELPPNYTFADSSFYILSWLCSNKDLNFK